jgi:hypothetical protein
MRSPVGRSFSIFLFLLVSLAFALTPTSVRADLFTASGTSSDGALSASANFSFGNGTLTVTLTNTLADNVFRSSGQASSDISFTLSNGAGTLSMTSAAGQFGNIDGNGNVTYTSSDDQMKGKSTTTFTSPTRWLGDQGFGSFSISGNTITLESIGGGQPSQMIAPGIANGGTYTDANQGLQNFNAYVIGPATFTLDLSGVTPQTTVSSATFSFGTGPDTFLPGSPDPHVGVVPAPSSVVLLGLGGLGLALVLARSRQRLALAA